MYKVSKEVFYNYVNSNNLKPQLGETFFCVKYIDKNKVVKAYSKSSSWGADTTYKINDENYSNMESLEIVTNLLNQK